MNEKYANYFDPHNLEFFTPSPFLSHYFENYIYFNFPAYQLSNEYFHPYSNGNAEIYFCLGKSSILIKSNNSEKQLKHFLFNIFDFSDKNLVKPITSDPFYSSLIIPVKFSAINYLFDIPLGYLANTYVDIEDFWGKKGKELKSFLNQNTDVQVIISFLDEFIKSIIIKHKSLKLKKINRIIEYCLRKDGILSVDELSKDLKISYRTLHRVFKREIGICPKEYLKILRFNKVCSLIKKYHNMDWTDLAYSCGYFDQSHFIHEFKNIMKYSPNDFLKLTNGQFYLMRPYSFEK